MEATTVKLVVYVPENHADAVRTALGEAGAGTIGNYTHCSFSSRGVGRYLPGEDAHPSIGEVGKYEEVPEERIEVTCESAILQQVVAAVKAVHPYEEVAFDVYPLLTQW
ncbi:N/A [soil metagenome]